MREYTADVVIIGGSTGGVAAALAAASRGMKVILTEETAWIGGQLTSQAVPPDEHPWMEQFGCTRSYRRFRQLVRAYYKSNFPLRAKALADDQFNPGSAIVSKLSHEPRAALAVMYQMLAPYIHNGNLTVWTHHTPVATEVQGDRILSLTVKDCHGGEQNQLTAPYFLDATETGELLPLAGVEYVTGSESQAQTGEPHALPDEADPLDMQAITHCFAVDFVPEEDHTIEKPAQYDFWRTYQADFWPDLQLSWSGVYPETLQHRTYTLFPEGEHFSLWTYRRVIDERHFLPGSGFRDVTIVNWPQNDYWLGPVFEVDETTANRHLEGAKQLSLSLLYWMQTEAPRHDGGYGYRELRLRKDVMGTDDGLAMGPYIRESRRIKACFTVLEQHISGEVRGERGAEVFHDSVGVGSYRIDLHPSTGNRHYIDFASHPFQIPLGSLIPVRMNNLLPACKNIGSTHITNGCYRLHPVEWNIGEVAGHLAAFALAKKKRPREVYEQKALLEDFQRQLTASGIELAWPKLQAL
ncbi:FAD-dependent oxidoreductase [Numidum massiliense]|uniref:FAD-dependent oxidoreductase n=1 Tax=Numidum massiliense TaxID=1522315 RepID=UPI0006D55190|nr:FAD-dependent oxidoreductase [Numidum massiliense]